jgi:long-chain acyl-CoA synthetase
VSRSDTDIISIICQLQLKGFEAIKAVHLETEPFDIEKDLVTPTFKKKRPQLKKHYQVQFGSQKSRAIY